MTVHFETIFEPLKSFRLINSAKKSVISTKTKEDELKPQFKSAQEKDGRFNFPLPDESKLLHLRNKEASKCRKWCDASHLQNIIQNSVPIVKLRTSHYFHHTTDNELHNQRQTNIELSHLQKRILQIIYQYIEKNAFLKK